jgi:predicted ATP-dependent endonuclease of OLD family
LPTHLSRIRIKNFRNFKSLDLPLAASTVVVGENKLGKTNLIYALRLVLDPSLPESSRTLRAEDFWDGLKKPFQGNAIEISIEVSGFDGDKEATAILSDCVVAKKPLLARLTYQFRPRAAIEAAKAGALEYEHSVSYVGMNPLKPEARARTKEDIHSIRHLYLDLDHDAERSLAAVEQSNLVPEPNVVIATSVGKLQIVWRVEGFPQEQAKRPYGRWRVSSAEIQQQRTRPVFFACPAL